MLLFLLKYLSDIGIKMPAAFAYLSTRMLLSALTALLITILLGPWVIKKLYELKTGQSIRVEDCPMLAQLHEKKKNTPTMGGVLILFSIIVSLFLWMDLTHSFTLLLLVTTLWLGSIGMYDDYLKLKLKNSKGLKARRKFGFQVLLAALISLYTLVPEISSLVRVDKWFAPPSAKEQIVQTASFIIPTQDSDERGKAKSKRSAPNDESIAEMAIDEEEDRSGKAAASRSPVGIKKEAVQTKPAVVATSLTMHQYMTQYYVPFYKDPIFVLKGVLTVCAFLFTIFVIVGSSNGVNLTDGLDGLASGCVGLVALVLGFVAFLSSNLEISRYLNILYIDGSGEIAIFLFGVIGACLGFLWYNGYPAQVFMGDTGSLALGGILGVSAVLLRREVLLAITGGVFVAEALSVIIQVVSFRIRDRKRVFLCAPLHHHFEYKGWPETKVVMRFWIIALLLAVVGVISLKLQ